ncbi:unnamed protein product [Parnassius apollo]|uniref:(apollo) hypothetical protein n=1 Tax=Parnassius apollo TaxID=110799 RepID=A0A8S3Y4X1_PARAO|nr:unnamed protein product [Parnassius apollo]
MPTSSLDICEDHINVEEDIENYFQWKLGKYNPRLKTSVPEKLLSMKLYEPNITPVTLAERNVPGCSRQKFSEEKDVQCDVSPKHTSTQVEISMVDQAVNTVRKKQGFTCQVEDIISEDEYLPSTQEITVEISGQETNTDSTLKEYDVPLALDFKKKY